MENNTNEITRKMYIAVDKTNEFREFDSHARNLGELKKELKAIGIDYTNCSFMEASTMATYEIDEAVFPNEVISPETGQKTSDLSFMLVSKNKNINSGRSSSSVSLDRKKACKLIKDNNLEDSFVIKYGKKPSSAKTDDIYNFLLENGLDDQIEVEKLDKFGNKIKTGKSVKASEKKEEIAKSKDERVEVKIEAAIELEQSSDEPEIVDENTLSSNNSQLIRPQVATQPSKPVEVTSAKPVEAEKKVVDKCSSLIDKIGLAIYEVFKKDATKEDLIDLIESQPEHIQKEIMESISERLTPKPSYSQQFLMDRLNTARRFKK